MVNDFSLEASRYKCEPQFKPRKLAPQKFALRSVDKDYCSFWVRWWSRKGSHVMLQMRSVKIKKNGEFQRKDKWKSIINHRELGEDSWKCKEIASWPSTKSRHHVDPAAWFSGREGRHTPHPKVIQAALVKRLVVLCREIPTELTGCNSS